jgi:chromosome segregation ATPase
MLFSGYGWTDDLSAIEERRRAWQEKLSIIKGRAQYLIETNNQLLAQQEQLKRQLQQTQAEVQALKENNAARNQLVVSRSGKTDQQVMIEQLNQQLRQLQTEIKQIDKEIKQLRQQVVRLRKTSADTPGVSSQEQLPIAVVPSIEEVASLRKNLETAKKQELQLEAKANQWRQQVDNPPVTIEEIDGLIDQLSSLDDQISVKMKELSPTAQEQQILKVKIAVVERRIKSLKNPEDFSFEWEKQRKRLIKDMAAKDQFNQSLRQKIVNIREDIELLKDQIAVLERRAYVPQRSH